VTTSEAFPFSRNELVEPLNFILFKHSTLDHWKVHMYVLQHASLRVLSAEKCSITLQLEVHQRLSENYSGRCSCRGRGVPVSWPARSPSLNPAKFSVGIF
jgi:hypothetical protein